MYLILLLNQDVRILNEYWLKFFHGKRKHLAFNVISFGSDFQCTNSLFFCPAFPIFGGTYYICLHYASTRIPSLKFSTNLLNRSICHFASHNFLLSQSPPPPPPPPIPLCFDPLPYRDVAAMATSESSSTVCSHTLQPSPHTARPSTVQACISILI